MWLTEWNISTKADEKWRHTGASSLFVASAAVRMLRPNTQKKTVIMTRDVT